MSRGAHNDLRVILVGRTGLDAALRLDPDIELVRVQTALEAVGELSNPVDEQSPGRAVVVLSPEVEWALRQPANGDGHETFDDFIKGVRIASPDVVLMGVTRNGTPGSSRGTDLDGTIAADLPSDMLRKAIRQEPYEYEAPEAEEPEAEEPAPMDAEFEEPPLEEPAFQPEPPPLPPPIPVPPRKQAPPAGVRPAPVAQAPSSPQASAPQAPAPAGAAPAAPSTFQAARQSQSADVGDLGLVALLVKGQDLLPRALELVRLRTGDDSVEFIPAAPDAPKAPASDQPVAWEGTTLGHLRAQHVPEPVLAVHAHWLASWLRARDQQSQLRAAAFTDPLTGAYNRRYFDRFLATAIDQAREAQRFLTVFVFDIDDFKTYNDRYGHDAGDEILRETVRLMRSVIRPTDRVCRIGGDEFAVIFHEPSGPREEGSQHPKDMALLAHRFQQQLQQHRFPKLSDCLPGTLTVSGGMASFPWHGSTPEELLARADQNALQSKRAGKNAITFGTGV